VDSERDTSAVVQIDRSELKGAIAGIYSLFGGAAILLLTKVGGVLFDKVSAASPFWIMVGANGVVVIVGVVVGVVGEVRRVRAGGAGGDFYE
jgi:hypothetical protein